MDKSTVNPDFEKYYIEIIKKLLVNQKSSRYITKNNYNVSRMEYIKKLFPDAKFIFMTRNPINHIASLAKQDKVLKELESDDERLLDWTKIMGHREFGTAKICINLDNLSTIEEIRKLLSNKDTYVEGWSIYWVSIHRYILDLLNKNKEIAKSIMLLRYKELTDQSEATIVKILEFTAISAEEFALIKRDYIDKLKQPDYYEPSFTDIEIKIIKEYTQKIAGKFGYQQ